MMDCHLLVRLTLSLREVSHFCHTISTNILHSAGGGGAKSKERKLKLQVKNEKLSGQRQRRALLNSKVDVNNGKASKVFESRSLIDRAAIQPSRRGMAAIERLAF